MKVGIVVPFSWSYWGGVVDHATHQAAALRRLGIDAKILCGNDPAGPLTKALHPRSGRHGALPDDVIPLGRSVIVPANGSLPNIILSPASILRLRDTLERERFDVLHLHEPMTPALCVSALAFARDTPVVATWHAAGELGWMRGGVKFWGFLMERIDHRIAVSELARESAARWLPGEYEIVPNGQIVPPIAELGGRENTVVFIGRHDPRKGISVLLHAWPEIHRRTGARLRLVGTDPLQARLLLARNRIHDAGIDILGIVPDEELTAELLRAKLLVSPALGGESFGMVLTRAFACGTPAVASDIPGYAAVAPPEAAVLVPPGDHRALGDAVCTLLADEERRQRMGSAARELVRERYAWEGIAQRLSSIYELVSGLRVQPEEVAP